MKMKLQTKTKMQLQMQMQKVARLIILAALTLVVQSPPHRIGALRQTHNLRFLFSPLSAGPLDSLGSWAATPLRFAVFL